MLKTKPILSALTASLALATLPTTASANSMSWFVNGTRLNGTEALNNTAKIDKIAVFNVPAFSLRVSCKALSQEGATISSGQHSEAERLKFEGCSEIEPSTCKLTVAEVDTEPILGLQVLGLLPGSKTESVFTIIHPQKSGSTLAEIKFTGALCPASELAVKGLVKTINTTGLTENSVQTGEGLGSFENNSLLGGGHNVYIEGGKILHTLASGSKWSFHE